MALLRMMLVLCPILTIRQAHSHFPNRMTCHQFEQLADVTIRACDYVVAHGNFTKPARTCVVVW